MITGGSIRQSSILKEKSLSGSFVTMRDVARPLSFVNETRNISFQPCSAPCFPGVFSPLSRFFPLSAGEKWHLFPSSNLKTPNPGRTLVVKPAKAGLGKEGVGERELGDVLRGQVRAHSLP